MALVVAGLLAPPSIAQTVTPQPATTIDPIVVAYRLLDDGCFARIQDVQVAVDGAEIEIDVTVVPSSFPGRCTPPVPLDLNQNLGRLPVGDYELTITGTIVDAPFDPATASFSVGPSRFGDLAAPIPALRPWGLLLLGLLVGSVALVRLRVPD